MKLVYLKSVVWFLLFVGYSQIGISQIQVDNTVTPEDVVAIIVGEGVVFSNVTYQGELYQFGSFDENGGGLGITDGIIMGTGDIELAEGPNDEEGATEGDNIFGEYTDADLEIIAGVDINDAALLEFDFIPTGNDITFHYVFASEEYNEYVCGTVNDAFGFFLSGPGINGTFSSPGGFPNVSVNMALIPGGNIGVSIGTVNNGNVGDFGDGDNCSDLDPNWDTNTAYFVDNENSTTIQYDGMTVVMEASYQVQCGETYHIKLAIGDGGDTSYDSGVFIEENSFSSPTPVSVDLQIDQDTDVLNGVYESCGGAILEFVRDGNDFSQELTIDLIYSGDAENGLDYDLPTSITFPANESTVQLSFDPYEDGLAEAVENVLVSFTFTDGCLIQDNIDLVEVFIVSVDPLTLSTNDVVICGDDIVELIPEVSGGVEPITYEWSNDATTSSIEVDGNGPLQYTVIVSDGCDETEDLDGVFNLNVGDAPEITYPPGNVQIICEETVAVECVVAGAYDQITFTTNMGDVIGNANPLIYDTSIGAESLTVSIIDDCGSTAEVEIPIEYNDPAQLQVDLGVDINASCVGQNVLDPNLIGGGAPFEYTWLLNGNVVSDNLNYSINTSETVQITFEVTDGCGQFPTDDIVINVPDNPITLTVSDDILVCPRTDVTLLAQASGGEEGFNYSWTNLGFGQEQTFNALETNEYTVIATDICGDIATANVVVNVIPFEVEYILEEVEENEYYFESITYPDCDGGCTYFWDFGDNSSATGETSFHEYDGLGEYTGYLSAINDQGCIDTVNFTIFPPITIYVPNSFSPNNDGINDVYRTYGIGVLEFEIIIFDRWGTVLFQSFDINEVWLGQVSDRNYYAQNEEYNYIVTAIGHGTESYTKRGVLTVLR